MAAALCWAGCGARAGDTAQAGPTTPTAETDGEPGQAGKPDIPADEQRRFEAAIEAVDAGRFDQAIAEFTALAEGRPGHSVYRYELAYAHYKKGDVPTSIEILEALREAGRMDEGVYYALLGNGYDDTDRRAEAVAVYEQGIERFPDTGTLYVNLGIAKARQEDYQGAIAAWETGMRREPMHPSNYFHAARMFAASSERLWAILYGELFLALEPMGPRADEISRLMFEAWNAGIVLSTDDQGKPTVTVQLTSNQPLAAGEQAEDFKLPFGLACEMALAGGLAAVGLERGSLGIAEIAAIREGFAAVWFDGDEPLTDTYPNALLSHHAALRAAGLFEAYHYVILRQGAPAEARLWADAHEDEVRAVLTWLNEHRLRLTADQRYTRPDYAQPAR
ncbi:tetratricopeptide repeat protein [Haliangium sp.]|uniref:tetratricopeptide repeat protein n=1 Tax=Haliangium sp. TaxID=2663208 RepID=UPI003D106C27